MYAFCCGNVKKGDQLEDLGIGGGKKLKRILNKDMGGLGRTQDRDSCYQCSNTSCTMFVISVEVLATDKHFPFKLIQ